MKKFDYQKNNKEFLKLYHGKRNSDDKCPDSIIRDAIVRYVCDGNKTLNYTRNEKVKLSPRTGSDYCYVTLCDQDSDKYFTEFCTGYQDFEINPNNMNELEIRGIDDNCLKKLGKYVVTITIN